MAHFYARFSQHGIRPDGRTFHECRAPGVTPGCLSTCDGSAMVRVGGTVVMCGVTATPLPSTPSQVVTPNAGPSLLSVQVMFSSGSSPRARRVGEAQERSRELTAFLRGLLCESHRREEGVERGGFFQAHATTPAPPPTLLEDLKDLVPCSGLVALASLHAPLPPPPPPPSDDQGEGGESPSEAASRVEGHCLELLKRFWHLTLEVVVVADDGGVEDAAVLATTAALLNTVLPPWRVRGKTSGEVEESRAVGKHEAAVKASRLTLRALPVATTFSLLSLPRHQDAVEGSSGSGSGSGSSMVDGGGSSELLLVCDPSQSNGEDPATHLTPMTHDSGSGGVGTALSLVGLGARGLAGAQFTLVHDAASGGGGGERMLLSMRKLGGVNLPLDTLEVAMRVSGERAGSVGATLLGSASSA